MNNKLLDVIIYSIELPECEQYYKTLLTQVPGERIRSSASKVFDLLNEGAAKHSDVAKTVIAANLLREVERQSSKTGNSLAVVAVGAAIFLWLRDQGL